MSHGMKQNDMQLGLSMGWHGKTKVVESIMGFPFEIARQVLTLGTVETPFQVIVCDDDNSIVGTPIADSFQYLSNGAFMERVRNAMEYMPGAVIASLGTYGARAKRYVSIQLAAKGQEYKVGNRVFQNHLNFQGALDGSMSDIVKGSNTCIVCQNTFNMSLGEASEVKFKAKHTKNHLEKWEGIEESLEAFFHRSEEFETLMRSANEIEISEEKANRVFLGFLGDGKGKEVSARTFNTGKRLTELFLTGKGNEGKTVLDVISAVTDYYSHESSGGEGDKKDLLKQVNSSEVGAGAIAKDDFLSLIRTKDFRVNKQAVNAMAKAGELTFSLSGND